MKVGYSKTYPILSNGQWEKNWLEDDIEINISIDATDEEIKEIMLKVRRIQYALKKQVEDFFYESNKAAEKAAIIEEKKEPLTKIDSLIRDINSCTEIETAKGLKSYELIAKSNSQLQEAYLNKLKSLT